MELTGRDFERIPRTNLHVPVRDFARLWLVAEQRADAVTAASINGQYDRYLFGVQLTCRWIAGVIKTDEGPNGRVAWFSPAPITKCKDKAFEELIQAESDAAERAVAEHASSPSEFVNGVHATLSWVWCYSGIPPIDVGNEAADLVVPGPAKAGRWG